MPRGAPLPSPHHASAIPTGPPPLDRRQAAAEAARAIGPGAFAAEHRPHGARHNGRPRHRRAAEGDTREGQAQADLTSPDHERRSGQQRFAPRRAAGVARPLHGAGPGAGRRRAGAAARALPGRPLRARLPHAAPAPDRHHPLGPVHGRAREQSDAVAVRHLSGRGRVRRSRAADARARDPSHRVLPQQGQGHPRSVRRHRRQARRRGAAHARGADRAPRRGPEDRERGARDRVRHPGDRRGHACRPARQPDRAHGRAGPGQGRVRAHAHRAAGVVDPVLALADPARPPGVQRPEAPVQRVPARAPLPADRGDGLGMRRALLAVAALCVACAGARAAPFAPPAALLGDEGVATTEDARALLVNPALLGQRYPSELWLGYSRDVARDDAYAAFTTWQRLGFGYSRTFDRANRYALGFSLGSAEARLGWTSILRAAAAPQDERDWDGQAGLMLRTRPWLSIGAGVEHVLEPLVGGERLPRAYTMGLGLRPLALVRERAHDAGVRLTLQGDVTLEEGRSHESARVRVGAALEPVPGLELRFTARDHGAFTAGLTLRGVRGSGSATGGRDQGDRAYESYSLSSHAGEERTALASRRERRVAVVRMAGTLSDQSLGDGLMGGGGT